MKRQKRLKRQERQRKKRNYRQEYRRRIARGLESGKSKSQARGHLRVSEMPKSSGSEIDLNDPRERAVRRMKNGETLKSAAKAEGISRERLRRYIAQNVEASRKGRRWQIVDHRPLELAICSRAKFRWVTVSYDQASFIGYYWNAVNRFLGSNDRSHLTPFVGKGVRDVSRKYFPLEVRPNTLRRLDSAGELHFLEIYKNVAQAGGSRHG